MSENTTQPFNAAALNDDELNAEFARVQTRGAELSGKSDLNKEEIAELGELANRMDALNVETQSRSDAAAALESARAKFAPVAEAPAAVEETTPGELTVQVKAEVIEPEPAAVVKSDEKVPSVAEMSNKRTPIVPSKPSYKGTTVEAYVSSGASGFTGKNVGEAFSGLTEIADALTKNAASFGRAGGGTGTKQAIAQFHRDRGAEFTVNDPSEGPRILKNARNEANLPGGSLAKAWQKNLDSGAASLTAAAGWCAPSENRYDICRLWGSNVGMLDVPTITVRRGGLNYTDDPGFAAIYANAVAVGGGSNFLTEAQVIADTVKTCSEIPCPTFENRRLDVLALCIRVSFLQAAGYPEVVEAWVDGLLEANAQEMNRIIIADMVTRGGAETAFGAVDPDGDSFTSALLASAELAAVDIRYREMMPLTSTIELVYPYWVLAQVRADLSRRNGVNMLSVSDAEIASLFSARNLRAQFVRGYQDGLITGGALDPTFPGGDATAPYLTALPSTVDFMAYPAGAVAVARQDVVTLTNVYDAASLSTNEFTRLFAEEGFAPVYPCPGLRNYTFTGCVGGITGAAQINCTDDTP
jgi:hypothetical protein